MKFIDVLVTKTRDGSTNISVSEVVFRTRTTDHSPRINFSEQKDFKIDRSMMNDHKFGTVEILIAGVTLLAQTIPENDEYIRVQLPGSNLSKFICVGQSELIMVGHGFFANKNGDFNHEKEIGLHVHRHALYESLIDMINSDIEVQNADIITDFLTHIFIIGTDNDDMDDVRKYSELSINICSLHSEEICLVQSHGDLFAIGDIFPRGKEYFAMIMNIWYAAKNALKPKLED